MTDQITTPDTTDSRVQDLSQVLGISPQEVLTEATDAAAQDGVTVAQELDSAEDVVTMISAFEGASDGTDLGDDGDDF